MFKFYANILNKMEFPNMPSADNKKSHLIEVAFLLFTFKVLSQCIMRL